MRILIEVGYTKILLTEGTDLATVAVALQGAMVVTESGYQSSRKLYPKIDGEEIGLRLVSRDAVVEDVKESRIIQDLERRLSEEQTTKWKLQSETAELSKKLAAFTDPKVASDTEG
jgi:hypothetical protein